MQIPVEESEQTYSVSWYPTFDDAMTAAALIHNYKENITILPEDENSYYFWYNDSKVVLLKNTAIAQGETITANSDDSICSP